jgi:hypothetical protein
MSKRFTDKNPLVYVEEGGRKKMTKEGKSGIDEAIQVLKA